MTHTAAYSTHSFITCPGSRVFPAGRQYARGPSPEDSGSMLDSDFRDRNSRLHRPEPAHLALACLALRPYGPETARWLLLLLPTPIGMIGFSHAASTDMPFSGMLTIAMVCAAVVLGLTQNENTPILPRTPWLALILFGFFLGLSVLAKGPAAIILSGGAIFVWPLFTN